MDVEIVVPALALRDDSGRLDEAATAAYAARGAATWIDQFLLSGTTTRGDSMTLDERAAVLDIWVDVAPPARLLAGCWSASDIDQAQQRGVAPIVVMRDLANRSAALAFLRSLPAGAYVYSHPAHSAATLDPGLCVEAREERWLPAGAKLAKIQPDEITSIRAAAAGGFHLWDASSRNIRRSVAAGATGVVATPLSPVPRQFPPRDLTSLQTAINSVQLELDRLRTRDQRSRFLHNHAAAL